MWECKTTLRRDQEVVDAKRVADEAVQRKMESDKAARKLQLIAEDAQILEEDKRVTKEIETMMVKYGMIEFERDLTETQDEMLDGIFGRQKSIRAAEKSGALTVGDNDTLMKLNLKKDLDLVYLRNKLRKNMHKRTATVPSPFVQDLSGTGQILTLKAEGIKEAGALSLAAELTRGACPMLETLNLNKCEVRSDGIGRIFQGIKTANLLSIRVLKLKGNFIRAAGLQYMQEVCPSGVFMNLSVLDISENELGDDGVTVIVNIILQGHFMSMVDLNLSANSITDQGFNKMVSVMKSLKDAKCPLLERLRLENNLVSAKARRSNAPYPIFFSI